MLACAEAWAQPARRSGVSFMVELGCIIRGSPGLFMSPKNRRHILLASASVCANRSRENRPNQPGAASALFPHEIICIYACVYTYIHTYIYIYIYRERERERYIYIHIYIYTYTHIHVFIHIDIYIYIHTHVYHLFLNLCEEGRASKAFFLSAATW